jgi:hypothetical protein
MPPEFFNRIPLEADVALQPVNLGFAPTAELGRSSATRL